MNFTPVRKMLMIATPVLLLLASSVVFAASSGSFAFNYAGDASDNSDGPQYDITLNNPIDDGSGCDELVMIMTDPNGVIVDIDTQCIDTGSGVGDDDGDYGANGTPTARPITYSLYDVNAADLAALSGVGSDTDYVNYVAANAVCLDEDYEDASSDLTGLPSLTPYTRCGSGHVSGCSLIVPVGSVVGEAPLGAQVYYEPGNTSPSVILNPGTYIVLGQDKSETYYKIMLACQFVWVRKDTMQPSYQAPQNGAALPTTIVG